MERQQYSEVYNLLDQIVDIAIARNKPVALARLYLFLASTYKEDGNRRKCKKYIDLSAELGNPEAQYMKGNQLIGVNSDLALDFLLKSAEQKVKVLDIYYF